MRRMAEEQQRRKAADDAAVVEMERADEAALAQLQVRQAERQAERQREAAELQWKAAEEIQQVSAATKIAAVHRGRRDRAATTQRRVQRKEQDEQSAAVTRIAAARRGKQERRKVAQMRSETLLKQRVAESANPLFDDEDVHGLVDRLPDMDSSDESGVESAGSDLHVEPEPEPEPEKSPSASPRSVSRAVDVPQTERQDAADREKWSAVKDLKWGRQLAAMEAEGWLQPAPDYDLIDDHLGAKVLVRDLVRAGGLFFLLLS